MEFQELYRDTWQTTLVFLSLLLFTRILGKTQVGQLTFYEYINGITIGSIAANIASSDPNKVWSHYYDLLLFVSLTYLLSFLTIKSRPLRKIIEGTPTLVIEKGNILMKNMRDMRYDLDELLAQLREKGITDISQVEYAMLETNGEMSIIKKAEHQSLTKSDLSLSPPNPSLPIELIMDGEVIEENLLAQQLSKDWLLQEIKKQGAASPEEVTYAVLDSQQQFFMIKKQPAADHK